MGYWKTKVLPKIKKVFVLEKNTKKAAAAEATKSFDDSKEEINKEFEEKKIDLQPKVIEIYEASSVEIKTLVKEQKEAGLKKHSAAVTKFLEELSKIEFPGSKTVSEASSKFGPTYVSGPVFFVFEKVSTFIVEEKKEEVVVEEEEAAPAAAVETSTTKEVDVIVEEKTEETVVVVEEKKEGEVVVVEEKKEETVVVEEKIEAPEAEKKVEEPPKA